mgnify:CR=1 FL=1
MRVVIAGAGKVGRSIGWLGGPMRTLAAMAQNLPMTASATEQFGPIYE